jgi:hypothetical protein
MSFLNSHHLDFEFAFLAKGAQAPSHLIKSSDQGHHVIIQERFHWNRENSRRF